MLLTAVQHHLLRMNEDNGRSWRRKCRDKRCTISMKQLVWKTVHQAWVSQVYMRSLDSHKNNYHDLANQTFLANLNSLHLPNLVTILSPLHSFMFCKNPGLFTDVKAMLSFNIFVCKKEVLKLTIIIKRIVMALMNS